MSKRLGLAIAIAALLGGGVLLADASTSHHLRRRPHSTLAGRLQPAGILPAAPATDQRRTTTKRSPRVLGLPSDLEQVAGRFLHGWLGCTYHQSRCSQIAGTLPAYAAALAHQHARSLPTPAEVAARPRVLAIRIVRSCGRSATAVATYQDGEAGRFDLHVNLVQERTGWQVFDVAEAPPHVPLPKTLNHGPGGC